ncbi:type II toxin-antitoxin system VapC family toxin [Halobium palmae]|uniref:Type II toxin-antitoxin system VapC family toxin n=1 Tax=Halobium palmae TaxID=1776492 RepID=A0ABD5RYY7_9EURY
MSDDADGSTAARGVDRYVFDASALVYLLRRGRIDAAFDGITTELAFYEGTNVFWKLTAARQEYTREEGAEFVRDLNSLRHEMDVRPLDEQSGVETYELAWDTGASGYDGAYLTLAASEDLPLVTLDDGLVRNAPDHVATVPPDGLSDVEPSG